MLLSFSNWRKRREYRQVVQGVVGYLLLGFPSQGKAHLISRLPDLWPTVDDARKRGANVSELGVQIAAHLVTNSIESALSAERKGEVLKNLTTWAEEMKGRTVSDVPSDPWVKAIVIMERQADMMGVGGDINPAWRDILMSEIIGALRGYSAAERSNDRIIGAIQEAVFPRDSSNSADAGTL